MSITLKYDADRNVLLGVATGNVSLEEFEEKLAEIVESDYYPADVDALWNIRDVDLGTVTTEYINGMIAIRKKFPERQQSKIAIVADEDLAFGLSRMYAGQSNILPQTVQVFRSVEDAEQWLGLSASEP